jgi:hypothetical protein
MHFCEFFQLWPDPFRYNDRRLDLVIGHGGHFDISPMIYVANDTYSSLIHVAAIYPNSFVSWNHLAVLLFLFVWRTSHSFFVFGKLTMRVFDHPFSPMLVVFHTTLTFIVDWWLYYSQQLILKRCTGFEVDFRPCKCMNNSIICWWRWRELPVAIYQSCIKQSTWNRYHLFIWS